MDMNVQGRKNTSVWMNQYNVKLFIIKLLLLMQN